MRPARLSGYLLIITGSLHTLFGLVSGYPWLGEMVRDGVIGAADASTERQYLVWFLTSGVGLILMGVLALGYREALSGGFGWGLLALSLVGVILLPTSGFWLLIPQALFVLVTASRTVPE